MPNRADHSVKTRRGDRVAGLKTWPMIVGVLVAVIGALTVIFTGGETGRVFGSALLTTIIILQIFLVMARSPDGEFTENPGFQPHEFNQGQDDAEPIPVLIMNISPLGRVRAINGQEKLLPGIRIGADVTRALQTIEGLSITRLPSETGTWVILIPESSPPNADTLLERTSFFAGLGHDLKSPLNAVIGFAEIMETELRGPMPEAYQDYPGLIKESGQALLRLVEDMLAYAKSEAGTYELDVAPMDIAASGTSVLRQSQAMADKAGITLRFIGGSEVLAVADADAVRRIWDNLVSNAIKYSASGEVVTLRAKSDDEMSIIQVSDTGAGMDADDLARIAKPFAQGRNARGKSGTGLGLAMVQRLAELQGGQVEIRTAPGAGTTVTVRLPAYKAVTRRAAE